MSALIPGLAMLVGCALTMLCYVLFDRWRAGTRALGSPTPTSARVINDKLDAASKEATVETDTEVRNVRQLTALELLELAKAKREKGRGR